MARYIQAFTLDESTIQAVKVLLQKDLDDPELVCLLGPRPTTTLTPPAPPSLDEHELTAENYAALYAALPSPRTGVGAKLQPLRSPDWESLSRCIDYYHKEPSARADLLLQIRGLQKANRRAIRKSKTHALRSGFGVPSKDGSIAWTQQRKK